MAHGGNEGSVRNHENIDSVSTLFTEHNMRWRKQDEQHSLPDTAKAREEVRVSRLKKMVAPGKENMTGKMSLSQNCSSRGTKLNVPQKDDKTVLVRQKGKISSPGKGKHPANAIPRVHLR